MKRLFAAAGLTCAFLAAPASAATIINGSFELGTDPGSFRTLSPGSLAITGWTVGRDVGGIDYIGSYWKAADGSRSLDLAGNGRGSIYQDVSTIIGQLYRVNFSIAGNPDGGAATKILVASVSGGDSDPFDFTNFRGLTTRSNMGWQTVSYDFVANSALSRLTFASGNNRLSPYGPALDNVSISAVPEPATWAIMLMGFGLIGFGLRRRSNLKTTVSYA